MILIAGGVAEILKALRCDRGAGDHRRAPRVGLRARVTIVPYNDGQYGQPADVWVRNLSAGGVSLLHAAPLRDGQSFVIRLPSHGQEFISVLCSAVHCQQVAGNLYRIGARFTGEPFKEAPAPSGHIDAQAQRDESDRTDQELRQLKRVLTR